MANPNELMTTGEVATLFGCQSWQVARIFELKLLPEPPRVNRGRVMTRADLPKIKKKLIERGFLKRAK